MIQSYLAQGSTYAGDIDFLFDMIFWIVGVWFLISSGVFFWYTSLDAVCPLPRHGKPWPKFSRRGGLPWGRVHIA